MQRKEFENRIKNLLPKAADDVVESWAAYATELDHYGTEVTADFYDKNYIALLLVKQRHGEEIATQLFNFGKCFTFNYFELQGAAEKLEAIHLSNGKEIEVTEHPVHNGNMWDWKIDSQVFDTDDYALNYLKKLVAEKLTGKRILLHKKREKPDICGYACRFPGKCNSALCSDCPVAEAFFAERDGVELVYAI